VFEFWARKGRPEGVDLAQCQAVGLEIELARDRQKRFVADEILCEIDPVVSMRGRFGDISSSCARSGKPFEDAEQLLVP
jgi:hypothetical protein